MLHAAFGPQRWWPGESDFEVAIGAVLTQNTAWTNVERAIANLRAAGCLGFRELRSLPHAQLERLIRPAGMYRVKAGRLRNLLDWMERECGGDLARLRSRPWPELRESLLHVHGVGPETADSILLYALGMPVFVVDAYTRRILGRHGFVAPEAGYSEIQQRFHRELRPDPPVYNEYHALLVRLAKVHCRTLPRCDGCPLDRLWSVSPARRPVPAAKETT